MGAFGFGYLQPVRPDPVGYAQEYQQLRALGELRQQRQQEMAIRQQEAAQVEQLNAIKIQNDQRAQRQAELQQQAFMDSGGDNDKYRTLMIQRGVSPAAVAAFDESVLKHKQTLATADKETLANQAALTKAVSDASGALLEMDPADREQYYQSVRPGLAKLGATNLPANLPPAGPEQDKWLTFHRNQAFSHTQLLADAEKERKGLEEKKVQAITDLRRLPVDPANGLPTPQAWASWAKANPELNPPLQPTKAYIAQQFESTIPEKEVPAYRTAQQQAEALAALTANPEKANLLVASRINPKKYPDEYNAALSGVLNAIKLGTGMKGIEDAIEKEATTIRQRESAVKQAIEEEPSKTRVAQATAEARRKAAASSPGIEIAAQALAKGDLLRLKDIASLRGDERLQIYARAKEINPKLDMAEVDRKIKMEDQFTNGPDGKALQSFGTFLEHAGSASDAVNQIRNTNIKVINKGLNWWRENLSGSPEYQAFITSLEPVRKEAMTFLTGGHALHESDRKAAGVILDENASPARIQEALKILGHTAEARFTEMNYRYKRLMGHDLIDPFSPQALAGAQKIGVNLGSSSKPSGGTTQQTSASGQTKQKRRYNPATGQIEVVNQ